MSQTNERLAELGIDLPSAPAPAGNYVTAMQVGKLLYLSGAICLVNGEMTHTGKMGETRDLDKISRIVQLNGFVNGIPGFAESPTVINGASDILVEILGDRGRHTRAAVAVTGLPKDSSVEIQAIFEVA